MFLVEDFWEGRNRRYNNLRNISRKGVNSEALPNMSKVGHRTTFETAGVALLTSTKKSVKFELKSPDRYFDPKPYYVSVRDLEDLVNGHKQTVTLWRPKEV